MNRHTNRRPLAAVGSPHDPRPALPTTDALGPGGRARATPPSDEAATTLLADILLGEHRWTMAEVRALITLREAAGPGAADAARPAGTGRRIS